LVGQTANDKNDEGELEDSEFAWRVRQVVGADGLEPPTYAV
jgi:hypothetical protein